MLKSSRPETFSAKTRRYARLFFIALVCWVISVEVHAGLRVVTVSTPQQLVTAFGDIGNPVHGPRDEVVIELVGGEYAMEELGDSGRALTELPSRFDVTLRPADPDAPVTITGGGPNSNFGFLDYSPSECTGADAALLRIENIKFSNFYTEENGAILSLEICTEEHTEDNMSAWLIDCIIEDVGGLDGGVVAVSGEVHLTMQNCKINRVSASGSGGVVYVIAGAVVFFRENTITDATAGLHGGVLYVMNTRYSLAEGNIIGNSHAFSQVGGHFYIAAQYMEIYNNQFHIPANWIGDLILVTGTLEAQARMDISRNTFFNIPPDGAGISPSSGSLADATVVATLNMLHSNGGDCVADPLGTGNMVQSGGANVTDDPNCLLNDPTDISVDELEFAIDPNEDILLVPAAGNRAIDIGDFFDANNSEQSVESGGTGLSAKQQAEFDGAPCGYKDIRGLARPQDGDGDGLFGCDAGAYEVQGGPDIGPAQSGAYFDLAHNGEGYFAEVLDNNLLFMAVFTYLGDGSGPAWYVGLGTVFGNGFVVDDLLLAKGGVFGEAFDATAITRTTVAGFSANFPTCEAAASPGRWVLDPVDFVDPLGDVSDEELAALLEEQTQVSSRLSQIVPCPGSDVTASASAFRSGSYFDPARSGEGIFVEVLPGGQILVIWYTFDPQGNQMWIIAQGSFDGTTATIDALYPTSFTPFGSQFDPDEVVLSPWGMFTLRFDTCNSLEFSYDSTAPGYGSGSLNYARLTQLAGTLCP